MTPHTLYPSLVWLNREDHTYTDKDGNNYVSFTNLYSPSLVEKFNTERISGFYGQKHGMSSDEVKTKWDNQRDAGTELDKNIKHYTQTGIILNPNLAETVTEVCKKYRDYHSVYDDLVIYNQDRFTSGEIDRISLVSKFRTSNFVISDFKRFEKDSTGLHTVKGQKWLNPPFDHLPNTKFVKISFQLSYYAYHFEELTGRKCERLFIDIIEPDGNKFRNFTADTLYLKQEVEEFFRHFKNEIANLVQGKEETVINLTDEF